ncbi:MAG TPA: OsmC family protein [Stellaceae bacterium]|nr:OsmC family protein [Stellaceae bacterium]
MSTITIAQTNPSPSRSIVNGIDTDAVHELIDTVDSDRAKGMTHWRVASAWQGGTHSRAQVDGFVIGGVGVPRRFAIDIDEPFELGGGNAFANPQEYLLAALNACMIVGYTALCALQGIALEKLEITTEGDIDLRGFFGLDPTVAAGYRELRSTVVIKGSGTEEQFRKIHDMVLATSPNFYNIARAVRVAPKLTIE